MTYYGAKDLASAFRTVRNNTIQIAEEIGEEHYGFRPTPENRSVAETLLHIANIPVIARQVRTKGVKSVADFMAIAGPIWEAEKKPHTKAEVIQKLTESRDESAAWLESLSESFLAESVELPPGTGNPPTKTNFEILLGIKEHEMHHRAQLMLIERMVGIVPHLTRQMQARMQAMQAQAQSATKQ